MSVSLRRFPVSTRTRSYERFLPSTPRRRWSTWSQCFAAYSTFCDSVTRPIVNLHRLRYTTRAESGRPQNSLIQGIFFLDTHAINSPLSPFLLKAVGCPRMLSTQLVLVVSASPGPLLGETPHRQWGRRKGAKGRRILSRPTNAGPCNGMVLQLLSVREPHPQHGIAAVGADNPILPMADYNIRSG